MDRESDFATFQHDCLGSKLPELVLFVRNDGLSQKALFDQFSSFRESKRLLNTFVSVKRNDPPAAPGGDPGGRGLPVLGGGAPALTGPQRRVEGRRPAEADRCRRHGGEIQLVPFSPEMRPRIEDKHVGLI